MKRTLLAKKRKVAVLLTFTLVTVLIPLVTLAQQPSQVVLPYPEPPFKGKIGRTAKKSVPDFPEEVQAPGGAPNVLLVSSSGRLRR